MHYNTFGLYWTDWKMKVFVVALLALVALTSARNINNEDIIDLEENTAYGYLMRFGVPEFEAIMKAEQEGTSDPTRIVGGSLSQLGQFPYQAGLHINLPNNRQAVCGAVLVNQRRALTAAHCWNDGRNQARSFTVILGSVNINSGGHRQTSSSVVMHPNWTPATIRNDIAMIRLNAVPLSNNIQPAALPTGGEVNEQFVGVQAVASGFGRTSDSGGSSPNLRHVTMPVISNTVCAQSHPRPFIDATNICTSGAGPRSICFGDSGGPLVITRSNRRVLIGITSFVSARGCSAGMPPGFVRVTHFNTWIRGQL